jgi:glycyl-tRNA synthetase beta chain
VSLPFLLEIGTEEIPDWMIERGLAQLKDNVQEILKDLNPRGIHSEATPRRLVVIVEQVQERKDDRHDTVKGPPVSAGDAARNGFLRKQGGIEAQLGSKDGYWEYYKPIPGRQTLEILAEALPKAVLDIHWQKTMVWNGKGTERFIRPIRWLVALLGDKVVPFEIGGVTSGNVTRGRRGLPPVTVSIANFSQQLRANGVILSADERRERIEAGISVRVKPDPDLLHTLTYITEFPTPILGSFDRSYLDLPQEVLVTVMRHHQKYLSVEDADGKLAPHFIAVMNTEADPDGLVRQGNEKVLRARFNDARFFWDQDQKKKLEARLEDLKTVTFQAKLGSYYDKTQRVVALVKQLGGNERAALLCKSDLTTDMVKEFTDLQGIVGGLYARAQGEGEEVAQAIYDHYKPLSMEDEIPRTEAGRILSLADKWDTLTECLKVGMTPTGSRDPFGLRRAAQGVVRIIVEGKIENAPPLEGEFMRDRVEYYFRDVRGFAYDEVRACMAAGWADLIDLEARLKRVKEVRATPDFEPIAASFKRIKNILKQAQFADSTFQAELLEPGPEMELYATVLGTQGQALEARIGPLRPKVDLFFDKVLVNADDPSIRRNRLALLHNLLQEFSDVADFSEIVTERQS